MVEGIRSTHTMPRDMIMVRLIFAHTRILREMTRVMAMTVRRRSVRVLTTVDSTID